MNVSVPKKVKGVLNVADYMCRFQAKRYAKGVTTKQPLTSFFNRRKGNEQNWYDSHIDTITEGVYALLDKLRERV